MLIRVGMAIFGVGFMLFSQITTPAAFFAAYFMMAVGSSLGGYLPVMVAIVNWFRRRRALALSISATGMAMGGFFVQIVVASLSHFGWRWTASPRACSSSRSACPSRGSSAITRVVRPAPDGIRPTANRRATTSDEAAGRARTPPWDWTSRRARPPHPGLLAHLARARSRAPRGVGGDGALIIHVTERLGYSLRQAEAVMALMTALQIAGQLTGGWVGDRGKSA